LESVAQVRSDHAKGAQALAPLLFGPPIEVRPILLHGDKPEPLFELGEGLQIPPLGLSKKLGPSLKSPFGPLGQRKANVMGEAYGLRLYGLG
jgi:hypothetical protein